jgi:hypothetical protein
MVQSSGVIATSPKTSGASSLREAIPFWFAYLQPLDRSNRRIPGSLVCGVADKLVMRAKIPLPIITVDLRKHMNGSNIYLSLH